MLIVLIDCFQTANHTREMDEMRKQLAVGQDALQKVDALLKEQTEMNSQVPHEHSHLLDKLECTRFELAVRHLLC